MADSEKKNVQAEGVSENGEMSEELQKKLKELDKESNTAEYKGICAKVIAVICICFSLFQIYTGFFGALDAMIQRCVHLSFGICLVYLLCPTKKAWVKEGRFHPIDVALAVLAMIPPIYILVNYQQLILRAGTVTPTDTVIGVLGIVMIIEAARRIVGLPIVIVVCCFLAYGFFGPYLPGPLAHRGLTIKQMVGHLFFTTEGVFGIPMGVSSTFIFLFILFGAYLEKTGLGKFFIDIANAIAGWASGGPAKVAVISSALQGTISGSSVANVVGSGSFTIPMMKKLGYHKNFAGAVEAAASTGGQLMPPVMGAAAFIMADTLGMKYNELLLSAIIPAVIYYMGILFQIQMRAEKMGMQGTPKDQLPKMSQVMKEYGHLALPIIFLVYMLFFSGKTVIMAAFYTIVFTIIVAQCRKNTRMTFQDILDAMVASAKSTVSVAIACACVGIIVGSCSITGFALNMANTIISIGGKSLMFTLVFTMITCMILGMGLPSIPSYIITSTIAAPALVQLGIPALVAHMFCFYFAMFANLTPPVALAAFAAAGIAGGSPMKTGWASVKACTCRIHSSRTCLYTIQTFCCLILRLQNAIQVAVTAAVGVFLISTAVEGYLFTKVNIVLRIASLIGAYLLIDSGLVTDIAGIVICAVVFVFQKAAAKKSAPVAA